MFVKQTFRNKGGLVVVLDDGPKSVLSVKINCVGPTLRRIERWIHRNPFRFTECLCESEVELLALDTFDISDMEGL